MEFLDYDNNIQRMTTCYSKETLMQALQIVSYYSDYDELRKGIVKAINLYDKKEIAEYREDLTENNLQRDACFLACIYEKSTLKKYLRLNKKIEPSSILIIDGVKIPSFFERDAIELAIKIYDDENICKRREIFRNDARETFGTLCAA